MNSIVNSNVAHNGIVTYAIPTDLPPLKERGFFTTAKKESITEHELEIQDFRRSNNVVKGPEGLDVQGFTYIDHESILAKEDRWYEGTYVEDVYFTELTDLVRKVTGAHHARVLNVAFRRKPHEGQRDPNWTKPKTSAIEEATAKRPKSQATVLGKDLETSIEPVRVAHIDFTVESLRKTLRFARQDIRDIGNKALEAEDAVQRGEDVRVPRYAVYSVWRPIKEIKRDGLAVCDWRTVEKGGLKSSSVRAPSEFSESGEYVSEHANLLPPKDPKKQRWYCLPNQKPNEVLFIKLADTEAEINPEIAGWSGHCSPLVKKEEGEEVRQSVEARVIAVWE